MNPLRTNFGTRKKKQLLSKIFTISDEAFALFVLYNSMDIWKKQKELINEGVSGKELVKAGRFCNGRSGKREAWSKKGLKYIKDLFSKLTNNIRS